MWEMQASLTCGSTRAASRWLLEVERCGPPRPLYNPIGPAVGTPVIHVPGADGEVDAFFGPVISPSPRGAAAGRLWDRVVAVAGTDGFFEVKRHRTRDPIFEA